MASISILIPKRLSLSGEFKMNRDICRLFYLQNAIMNYAWGSRTAIAALQGREAPAENPEAELWMGAHPKAPSAIKMRDQWVSLADLIAAHPEAILGPAAARRFEGRLPFLFKILAADAPLSIQAHPDEDQARLGFARENREGVPLDAPDRNYRDRSHKPEILCALTPFWGLNGFQPPAAIASNLQEYAPQTLATIRRRLNEPDVEHALEAFFSTLLDLPDKLKQDAIVETTAVARTKGTHSAAADWVLRLEKAYPGDIGVLAPLFLNLVCLSPGQAMFLAAGQLHAYLEGVGIELMANSDNVLRGGLTPKHIDVPELMRVLRLNAAAPRIILPQAADKTVSLYAVDVAEFALAQIELAGEQVFFSSAKRGMEILLTVEGAVSIYPGGVKTKFALRKGASVMVPACLAGYSIRGEGKVFRASIPLPTD